MGMEEPDCKLRLPARTLWIPAFAGMTEFMQRGKGLCKGLVLYGARTKGLISSSSWATSRVAGRTSWSIS